MDYLALKAEIGLTKYAGMTDPQIATAIVSQDIPTTGNPLIATDDFVARFTAAEFAAAQASSDATVRQYMFRLSVRRDPLDLSGATVMQGLQYLASVGILTTDRPAVIGAIPAGPNVARCQQIGCSEMLDMDASSRSLCIANARNL